MWRWMWVYGCSELLLTACGDPLVGADYLGESMLSLSGEVLLDAPIEAEDVGVAVLWNGGPESGDLRPEEKLTTETDFPARYAIHLLAPPIGEVIHELPGSAGGRGSIGLVVVYEDENLDGRIDMRTEELLGVAEDIAVMWFANPPAIGGVAPPEGPADPPDDGYAVMRQAEASCGGAPQPMEEVEPDQVHLVVGDICGAVIDPDCNPETIEWGPICGGAPP